MKDAIIFIIILGSLFLAMSLDGFEKRVVRYDCSLSEISPDYPVDVKEACRKLRAERINK